MSDPSPEERAAPRARRWRGRWSIAAAVVLGAVVLGGAAMPFVLTPVRTFLARRAQTSHGAPAITRGRCPEGMGEIPAGTYRMGGDEPSETPPHEVTVEAFCLDGTEVTVEAYSHCVKDGKCTPAATNVGGPGGSEHGRAFTADFCNADRSDRRDHPINCVAFAQAEGYCRALDKRLPREEEWERAARGDDGRTYPWGEAPPGPLLLNACGDECAELWEKHGKSRGTMYEQNDGWPTTAPVGSYPAGKGPYGIVDLAGNVWEWTTSKGEDDPRAPGGDVRIIRGGSWGLNNAVTVRATARNPFPAASPNYALGFRCAKTLP